MPIQSLSADDLKNLVATELRKQDALGDVDSEKLVILPRSAVGGRRCGMTAASSTRHSTPPWRR